VRTDARPALRRRRELARSAAAGAVASEGDFLAEAHAVAPAVRPPAPNVAVGASPQAVPVASDRERLAQLLDELRKYGFDPQSGLSLERREALRVLLRRERELDLMNPWGGH